MRIGGVLVVIWVVIGLVAAYQRGYLTGDSSVSCARLGTVLITVVAGPVNYVGANPKIACTVPRPSA